MEEKHKPAGRNLLIVLSLVFILSLVPLYYIGLYAHPNADDYSYGISTKFIWEHTHSFSAVLHTAAERTADKYYNWQGNFSAIFLMYLQPGIFGEQYYFAAPFLLLTSFILFSFFFYYSVFRKVAKSSVYLSFLASILLLFFTLQFTYLPSDSFYWYNGAVYYTFFYSLSLLLYGMLIWLAVCKPPLRFLFFAASLLLSFLVGGSNYATALLNAVLLFFVSLYFLLRKNRLIWYYLPVFLTGLLALCISISGPGNALRQGSIGSPHNPLTAILLSFVYGGYSAANATTVPVLLFWLLMIPVFWKILKKSPLASRLSHPLLFFLFTFCIYSAQITPVIYAQGIRIPYRIRNIVCFNYYIFIAVNLFYLLGYLRKKHDFSVLEKLLPLRVYCAGVVFALVISCLGAIEAVETPSGKLEISNLPFTASAVYSLATGEAKGFDEESNERVRILSDPSHPDIVFPAFVNRPHVLYHSDISHEPGFWKNRHLAKYYDKRTVRLEQGVQN